MKYRTLAIWFGISFIAPLYYGLSSWWYSTASPYIVQDDARYHIVWLQRLIDPSLFPNDFMADYYSAIQPVGFKMLYAGAAALGIEPLVFAKVVPLLLALMATTYLFWVALMLLPVPMSGVLVTLIFNQNVWIRDDLISASPRAFVYPLFSAFLYYLLRDSTVGCLVVLGLLGIFYPQMMLVAMGLLTLRLVRWHGGGPRWPERVQDYFPWLLALVLTGGLLLLFSVQVGTQVGRLTSLAEMKVWPEFQLEGRGEYFGVPLLSFWFDGLSGARFPLFPPIIWLGSLLPFFVQPFPLRIHRVFPLSQAVTSEIEVLGQLLLSATGLFLLAHAIFPTLYLPSRYSFYSTRFVLILSSGVMLTLISQYWWAWLGQQWRNRKTLRWLDWGRVLLGVSFAIAVLVAPAIPTFYLQGQSWEIGKPPAVYDYLLTTPKDTLVASLVREVNDTIPAFAQRSVVAGREFALPYHVAFYQEMLQRMKDLVTAQYSPDLAEVKTMIQTYGVDVWIVARDFATPGYLEQQDWLIYSSANAVTRAASEQIRRGIQPALARALPVCTTFSDPNLVVLDAQCISQLAN